MTQKSKNPNSFPELRQQTQESEIPFPELRPITQEPKQKPEAKESLEKVVKEEKRRFFNKAITGIFIGITAVTTIGLGLYLPLSKTNKDQKTNVKDKQQEQVKSETIDGIEVKVNDSVMIPNTKWVKIENSSGVKNYNVYHGHGDECVIKYGGKIRVFDFPELTGKKKALVVYTTPRQAAGTLCPTGTKYLIELKEFITLQEKYDKRLQAENEMKADANQGIGYHKGPVKVGDTEINVGDMAKIKAGKWVEPIDHRPVDHSRKEVTCVIEKGGKIRVTGFTRENFAIVRYVAPKLPRGTPCRSGVKFVMEPETFLSYDIF